MSLQSQSGGFTLNPRCHRHGLSNLSRFSFCRELSITSLGVISWNLGFRWSTDLSSSRSLVGKSSNPSVKRGNQFIRARFPSRQHSVRVTGLYPISSPEYTRCTATPQYERISAERESRDPAAVFVLVFPKIGAFRKKWPTRQT